MSFLDTVAEMLPVKKLGLPLYGFPSGDIRHIFVQCLNFRNIWNRMGIVSKYFALRTIWKRDLLGLYTYNNFPINIFGLNFEGVQEMGYQGFTMYNDRRLSSFTSSLKYVLNPSEFVLYGQEVHSMTDGEVVEVCNKYPDMIQRHDLDGLFGRRESSEHMFGNYVIIRENGIEYFYGGLQRNSMMRLKIGERVKLGDVIGKVGCQGLLGVSPFLHVHARVAYAHVHLFKDMGPMDTTLQAIVPSRSYGKNFM